jgi:predicted dehydrogenase
MRKNCAISLLISEFHSQSQNDMNETEQISRRAFLTGAAALAVGASISSRAADKKESANAEKKGGRIGFVDLNLENYHANVFLQALRGPLADRGFTITGATGTKTAESRAWAEKNRVPFFEDDAALNAAVDYFMVLAPSNPEVHLELCARIFPFHKPTYVDKTFAPNAQIAQKIFALADEHGARAQTSSALRYTNVQTEVAKGEPAKVEHMIAWGGGGSFDEYAIHPLEMLISVMGHEATALMRRGTPEKAQLLINFTGGRTGVVNVFAKTNTPFAASFTTAQGTRYIEADATKFFVNNLAAVLDFFSAGKPNIDRRESLALMRLLDAARDPRALKNFIPVGAASLRG